MLNPQKKVSIYPGLEARKSQQPSADNSQFEELGKLSFNDFNIRIGLPPHVKTGLPAPMAPFQLAYVDTIEKMNERYHMFLLNKSRQSTWSETHLRLFAWRGFRKYSGKQCKIIAGTRAATTKKLMQRLKNCFRNIPETLEANDDSMYLELKNGTSYEGLPANPEAATGDTQIKAFLLDESTKWNLVDDQPVMNSIMPIVRTNHADLFAISTPKGPRGWFYQTDMNQETTDWFKMKYSIWITEGYLYTHDEILQMINDPTVDGAQEFLNQYTTGRDSIFGTQFNKSDFEAEVF